MEWTNQLPNADGLWLWKIPDDDGIGVLLVKGDFATEMTVVPTIRHYLIDWNETSQGVKTYYVGKE